jgi:hypothetical protein
MLPHQLQLQLQCSNSNVKNLLVALHDTRSTSSACAVTAAGATNNASSAATGARQHVLGGRKLTSAVHAEASTALHASHQKEQAHVVQNRNQR